MRRFTAIMLVLTALTWLLGLVLPEVLKPPELPKGAFVVAPPVPAPTIATPVMPEPTTTSPARTRVAKTKPKWAKAGRRSDSHIPWLGRGSCFPPKITGAGDPVAWCLLCPQQRRRSRHRGRSGSGL